MRLNSLQAHTLQSRAAVGQLLLYPALILPTTTANKSFYRFVHSTGAAAYRDPSIWLNQFSWLQRCTAPTRNQTLSRPEALGW